MAWPRLRCKLFVFFCIALLWRPSAAISQMMGPGYYYGQQQVEAQQARQTAGDIDSQVKTDGDCQLTDDDKKKYAQQAQQATQETVSELVEFNKLFMRSFKDENGACHYLDNRLTDTSLSDDANRYDLLFTDYDKAGAKQADSLNNNTATTANIDEYENKLTYAGIDVRKLGERAGAGNFETGKITKWAQSAKVGERYEIDEATSELLEEAFGFKLDCHHVFKLDSSGSFACDQRSGQNDTAERVTMNIWASKSPSDFMKTPAANMITFVCTASNCYDDDGNTYGSYNSVMSKYNERAEKCRSEMEAVANQRDKFLAKRKEAHQILSILSGHLETNCTCEDAKPEETSQGTDGQTGAGNAQSNPSKVMNCEAVEDPQFQEDNIHADCKLITEYQKELSDTCTTCSLLATIAGAAQNISKGSFETLAGDLCALLGIAFLIYICYITLITIASPEAQKISKYLTSILTQGFKVALTVLILQNPTYLYKQVLGPILDSSVDFGLSLTNLSQGTAAAEGEKYVSKLDASNKYLDAKTLQNLVGVASALNDEVAIMPALGRAMICHSFEPNGIKEKILNYFFPFPYQFSLFIEGCILYIFGIMILLALIAYMLDCMVGLGFVCAIIPFCIACWPFKITSNYSKVCWNMFLNVFFNFVMLAVVVITIVELSTQAVSGGMPSGDFQQLVNGNNVGELRKQMNIGGLQMLIVVVCAMICLKLPKEIAGLANKFAGGAQFALGSQLLSLAAQIATQAVKKSVDTAVTLGTKMPGNAGISMAYRGSGMKGLVDKSSAFVKGRAAGFAGRLGLGSKAKMGAKGRDQNANQARGTESGFKKD